MKVICGPVDSGKTKKLLQEACAEGAVVVCKNPERMNMKAKSYEIFGVPTFSYTDYVFGKTQGEKVLIDDLESFLTAINPDTIGFCYNSEENN